MKTNDKLKQKASNTNNLLKYIDAQVQYNGHLLRDINVMTG